METTKFNNQLLELSDMLFRMAKSILRNAEEAQDAVQELSVKLWMKRDEIHKVDNFRAFAMQSMRNQCLDFIRQRRETDDLPETLELNQHNPYLEAERKDMVSRISEMIDQLPELQKTIIRMRDVEGMEIAEIAEVVSISENAVSANLSRARQRVREQLLNEQKKEEATIWKE